MHYGFRARLFTRVRPSFFTELNAESAQKALRALLGHMMCVADWLLPGRHNHQEGTTACDCTWIGGER